jgi:hypothetical protein
LQHFFVNSSSHKTKSEVSCNQNTYPKHLSNTMNLTKSVRELAADINAAPDNYDSNDEVSEKCLSIEAEFEAAGVLCHKGEGATDGQTGKRMRPSHW